MDKHGAAPIDSGWAWVVMAAVMLSTFLDMGLYKSFGIFFVEYIEKFGSSATITSVISGIYLGGYSIVALVMMTYGLGRISSRQSVMFGGVFLSIGYLLSSFATTIQVVFVAQGVFAAIGSACTHGPSIVILSKYFDKRRGLSNSLAISCASLGGLVLPILFHALVKWYNLKGALLITSGIILNCTVAGALMRPIDQYQLNGKLKSDSFSNGTENVRDKENISKLSNINTNQTLHESQQNVGCSGPEQIKGEKTDMSEFSGSCISLTHIASSTVDVKLRPEESDNINSKCVFNFEILSQIFDCSLFRNMIFMILLIAGCLGQIECALALIFIPPYAKDQGVADSDIPFIAGTIGIAEFTGRCFIGMFADVKFIDRHMLIAGSLIITGIVTQCVHLYDSVWTFVVFAALYGLFSGVLVALYSPVCVDLLGPDSIRKTYGISCCFNGVVTSLAAPFFGFLRDVTGSYELPFHLMGSCAILGGSLLLLVPWAKRYEENKLANSKTPQQLPLI
ncbi:monocarboxylate transporter 5-like [Ylistrum balloti]|uniref:monocarboxylate transporter 5-like n=1 Tax=Ylistrum balloti TaxID=509963 RepID=UPI002905C355|nr:monocarboxylate transporter 5-like [Ylistrum balloti]